MIRKGKEEAAIGVILDEAGEKVLLVQRRDFPVWVLPGGGIDPGESSEDAAIREVFEESGYRVAVTEKLAEFSPVNRLAQVTHIYAGKIVGGDRRLSDESGAIEFFAVDDLPDSFFPVHKDWLIELLAARREKTIPVKRTLREVNYPRLLWHLLQHPISIPKYLIQRWLGRK